MAIALSVATGVLLAVEPAMILTEASAGYIHQQTRPVLASLLRNARLLARRILGEYGLLSLPEELLIEIVKGLSWQDVLRIRVTCLRLNTVSRSLPVWRNMVECEPRDFLWLESPITVYGPDHLEYLFLRRKRAEMGFNMMAAGAMPRLRTIPVSVNDTAGPAHLIRGGRWWLLATNLAGIIYYDLELENPQPQVLTPEQRDSLRTRRTLICIEMDSTSPTLKFNLAVCRTFFDEQHELQGLVEVWQVDLVQDGNGLGIGLEAKRLASFNQEPTGPCRRISLVGDQLAMAIYYRYHEKIYAVVTSWRTIRGYNYPKRVLHPAAEDTCLVQPDTLMSPRKDVIELTSCLSLPEVTTLAGRSWSIPNTPPCQCFRLPIQEYMHWSLSDPAVFDDSIRFLVYSHFEILAIIIYRQVADGTYCIRKVKILHTQDPLYDIRVHFSGDLLLGWNQYGGLHLQRFSWGEQDTSMLPVAHFNILPRYEPSFQFIDIVAGRVVVPDSNGVSILDFTLPRLTIVPSSS